MAAKNFHFLFVLFVLSLFLGAGEAAAQEFKLKAAWIYKFGNELIDWDEDSEEPFVIGVYGRDPGDLVQQLGVIPSRGLQIRGRRVVIEQYEQTNDLTAEKKPDILFICRDRRGENSLQDRVNKAKELTRNRPVLLVGDQNDIQNDVPISFRVDVAQRRLMLHRNERLLPEDMTLRNRAVWNRLSNVTIVRSPTGSSDDDP